MPPKRMTANPVRAARYRPGKATGASDESSSEEEENEEEEENAGPPQAQIPQRGRAPPPKATSFANVDLNARRREAEAQDRQRIAEERRERERMERDAGFVTESESGEDDSSSDDDGAAEDSDNQLKPTAPPARPSPRAAAATSSDASDSSDEDDSSSSSSDDDTPARLRPTFIRKGQRAAPPDPYAAADARAAADAQRKQDEADALVRERIERQAAARAAGKKGWDDDEGDADEIPDDTDGVDAELEHAQWVARELARLKRARAALEQREAEIAEVERRRGLSSAERDAEDRAWVGEQQERKRERGQMAPLQKYHHKGAFFADDAKELGLLDRDLMGARFEDQTGGGGGVPEYLQVRDATMIGRKGRTRYKDMKSEDTGRWGEGFDRRESRAGGGGYGDVKDDRFRPDYDRDRGGGPGATGANASAVGQKRSTGHDREGERDGKRARVDG